MLTYEPSLTVGLMPRTHPLSQMVLTTAPSLMVGVTLHDQKMKNRHPRRG